MIENLIVGVVCLLAGGIGSKTSQWVTKRSSEDETTKLTIVKLTSGIEHIASELTAIREDMRVDRRELFGRLGTVEQRVARLEATAEARHDD
jgi:hypothetical protein